MPQTGVAKTNEVTKGKHAVKARHSSVYLRARIMKVLNESLTVLENESKPIHELLADAIKQNPLQGLQLISRFLPREQEMHLHSAVDLHLHAVRDLVDEAKASIARQAQGARQFVIAQPRKSSVVSDPEDLADALASDMQRGDAPGHGQSLSMSRRFNLVSDIAESDQVSKQVLDMDEEEDINL